MIRLQFIIEKPYLAFLLINRFSKIKRDKDLKEVQSFEKIIKDFKNNPYFYLLKINNLKHTEWGISKILLEHSLDRIGRETEQIIRAINRTDLFRSILQETEAYKREIELQWKRNQKLLYSALKSLLKEKDFSMTSKVVLVHPSFSVGKSFPENLIVYGHKEEWPNYNLVYLVHEFLHIIFYRYGIPDNRISHALIELIADNEIRFILNKKHSKTYFKEGRCSVGHPSLRLIEKQILPYWLGYLKNKRQGIIDFYNNLEELLRNKS